MTLRDLRVRALAAAEFAAADYRRQDNWNRDDSRRAALQRFVSVYWRHGVQMDVRTAKGILSEAIRLKEIYA